MNALDWYKNKRTVLVWVPEIAFLLHVFFYAVPLAAQNFDSDFSLEEVFEMEKFLVSNYLHVRLIVPYVQEVVLTQVVHVWNTNRIQYANTTKRYCKMQKSNAVFFYS